MVLIRSIGRYKCRIDFRVGVFYPINRNPRLRLCSCGSPIISKTEIYSDPTFKINILRIKHPDTTTYQILSKRSCPHHIIINIGISNSYIPRHSIAFLIFWISQDTHIQSKDLSNRRSLRSNSRESRCIIGCSDRNSNRRSIRVYLPIISTEGKAIVYIERTIVNIGESSCLRVCNSQRSIIHLLYNDISKCIVLRIGSR